MSEEFMKQNKTNTNSSQEVAKQEFFTQLKLDDEDGYTFEDYTGIRFILKLAVQIESKCGINILAKFNDFIHNDHTEVDYSRLEDLEKQTHSIYNMKEDDLLSAIRKLSFYAGVLWNHNCTLSLQEMLKMVNRYYLERGGSKIQGGIVKQWIDTQGNMHNTYEEMTDEQIPNEEGL